MISTIYTTKGDAGARRDYPKGDLQNDGTSRRWG